MNKLILTGLLSLLGITLTAQNVDVNQSFIHFYVKNLNIHTVQGHFTNFKGNIHLTPTLENKGDICLSIDIATINTGIIKRDKALLTPKYFHVDKYPVIKFESSDIHINSDSTFTANGILSMKGISKAMIIPFEYTNKHFTGELTLNRQDFNVGGKGTFLVDNNVRIHFDCTTN